MERGEAGLGCRTDRGVESCRKQKVTAKEKILLAVAAGAGRETGEKNKIQKSGTGGERRKNTNAFKGPGGKIQNGPNTRAES